MFSRFFNTNKNKDYLIDQVEKDAATILGEVIEYRKEGNFNQMNDRISDLAVLLYQLAFRRSKKDYFDISKMDYGNLNPQHIAKHSYYLSLFKALQESIENFSNNQLVLTNRVSRADLEGSVLALLKTTADRINAYS